MENITFNGVEFPVRSLSIHPDLHSDKEESNAERYILSTVQLEEKLMTDDYGSYVNHEARLIDERIFYYLNEDEWRMTDEQLIKFFRDQAII